MSTLKLKVSKNKITIKTIAQNESNENPISIKAEADLTYSIVNEQDQCVTSLKLGRLDDDLILEGSEGQRFILGNYFVECEEGRCNLSGPAPSERYLSVGNGMASIESLMPGQWGMYEVHTTGGVPLSSWLPISLGMGALSILGTNKKEATAPHVGSEPVPTPTFSLRTDAGASANDGITNDGNINVFGLKQNSTWKYSIDAGVTWIDGVGSGFKLAQGTYTSGQIQVYQADSNGKNSAVFRSAANITIDTNAPTQPAADLIAGDDVVGIFERHNGLTISGTSENGSFVTVNWGGLSKKAFSNAGKWEVRYEPNEIPPDAALSTINFFAIDAAGNVSESGHREVSIQTATAIHGKVTAGPILPNNGLVIDAYRGDGTFLAGNIQIAADGTFSINGLDLYIGDVIVLRVRDTSEGPDYLDEATGAPKDLNVMLLAAKSVADFSGLLSIQITPLSTIAARIAGLTTDGEGIISAAKVENAIAQVAKFFGLPNLDASPVVVNGSEYHPEDGLSDGEKIGVILAALSGADMIEGGNSQKVIADIFQHIDTNPELAAKIVFLGAAQAIQAENATLSLVTAVSDLLQTSTASGLSIGTVANSNVITAANLNGLMLQGEVGIGAAAATLTIGSFIGVAAVSNNMWTYLLSHTDMLALSGEGVRTINISVTYADGHTENASRHVLVDTVVSDPSIDAVAIDDLVNKLERAEGVNISGLAEPGSSLTIQWGLTSKSVNADTTGKWVASFLGSEIPSDGPSSIQVEAKDKFGNLANSVTKVLTIDTESPAVPTINAVAGNDHIGPLEALDPLRISGKSEIGATVSVAINGDINQNTTADSNGDWFVDFPAQTVPSNGMAAISAVAIDASGNASQVALRQVFINRNPAAVEIFELGNNGFLNLQDALEGFEISGIAPVNSLVRISFGDASRNAEVNANGDWLVRFGIGDLPSDGAATIFAELANTPGSQVARSIYIDTSPPESPSFDAISDDNLINSLEAASGILLQGAGEAGCSVVVSFASSIYKTVVNELGQWQVNLNPTDFKKSGTYEIFVQLEDAAGNISTKGSRDIVFDGEAPLAPTLSLHEDTGSSPNDWITNNPNVVVAGLEQGSSWEYSIDNGETWNSGTGASFGIEPGDYDSGSIRVRQTDVAGNTSPEWRLEKVVSIDTEIYGFDAYPVNGTNQINANQKKSGVTFTGTAEIGDVIEINFAGVKKTTTANGDSAWSVSFSENEIPADGLINISATARDAAGNIQNINAEVLVDAIKPAALDMGLVLDTGDSDLDKITSNGNVDVANIEAGATWEYSTDGGVSWAAGYENQFNLSEGNYRAGQVKVRQIDGVGNIGDPTSNSVSWLIDGSIETPSINNVTEDDVVNALEKNAGVLISGNTEANSIVALKWGDSDERRVRAGADGKWSYSFAKDDIPSDGSTTIEVTSTDLAGNVSETLRHEVLISTILPPEPNINTIGAINSASKAQGVTIAGTASLDVSNASVVISWGSLQKNVSVDAFGNWAAKFLPSEIPSDGVAVLRAVLVDSHGNQSVSTSQSITIDTTSDAPSIYVVGGDDLISSAEILSDVVIAGRAEAGASVSINWDGVSKQVFANDMGEWSVVYAPSQIPGDGSYSVSAVSVDSFGNTSAVANRPIKVDSVAPSAPSINATGVADILFLDSISNDTVRISGSAEPGALIKMTWGNVSKSGSVGADGNWVVDFARTEIPDVGDANIVAQAFDLAGNGSLANSRTVAIANDRENFLIAPIAFDNVVGSLEKSAGLRIFGTGSPLDKVEITFGEVAKKTVVGINGVWTASFDSAQLPGDGLYSVNAIFGDGSRATRSFVIDTRSPTVTSFSSNTANGSYKAGDAINISATMSEAVRQGSNFEVTLNTGEKVTLTAATAGDTLSGTYTVAAGNSSADLTVASFAAGTVKDAAGNAMTSTTVPAGTSNIAGSKDIVVDTAAPTLTSFSSTTANGSYKAGDAINITATMSEAVQQGSSFVATLNTGEKVTLTAAAAGTTLSGTYTVVAGNNSADLTVASFAAGTVKDAAGNAMTSTTVPAGTSNIAGSKDIVVDALPPTVTSFSSTTANGSYKAGDAINITATMSEAVQQGSSFDVTLDAGEKVTLTAAAAGTTLSGTYTVVAGNNSADLTVASFATGTVKDAAGNAMTSTTVPAGTSNIAGSKDIVVDALPPTVTSFSSTTANGSYKAGDAINITATMSEAVQQGSSFDVTLDAGEKVTLTAAAAGTTLSGTYTVVAGNNSADLTVASFATGTVKDAAGNAMTSTTVPAGTSNIAGSKDIVVDALPPTVTSFSSTTANGSYKAGDAINITATMSEAVQQGSTFDVTLDTGEKVTLTAAAAGTTLSGTYTVVAGNNSADLTVASFATGTVKDAVGNAMTSTTVPAGTSNIAGSKDIVVDALPPTVTSFSSTTANGSYKAGDAINITATMSEAVQQGSSFVATLNTGEKVTLTAAAAGTTLSGTYTVVAGNNSADLTVASFAAGTVKDAAGNAMTSTTVPAGTSNIAGSKDIVVDTAAPTLTSFSSTTANGSYKAGDAINITATMSEAVQQGSSFVATLNTGEKVTLTAAAAGTTLSGTYTVVAGNNSADLTVASFAAGTVKDAAGNAMTSTTVPAGTSNIAGSKDIVVDALPPTVTSFSSTTANGSYKAGDAINITATMSEAVQQGSSFDVTLDAGEKVTLTAAAAGTTLSGTYTVVAGNNSADLTVASFATGTVKDAAGNAMTSTTVPAGTSNIAGSKDIVVDALPPTVTSFSSTTANGSYIEGDAINITATMSEAVQQGSSFVATLNTGEKVTLTAAAAGTTLSGTYTVVAGNNSADLTVASFATGTVKDAVGNAMTSTTVPAGTSNIAGSKDIVVDTAAPTVTSFSSTTANGSYIEGDAINITATMSEAVQQGSSFVATLNTGEKVTLTAAAAGTTLSGTYTVVAGNNSADLTVASFATGTVKDAVGNAMTSTAVPAGTSNIAGSKDIVVDTAAPTVTSFSSTTANGSYKAGDAINITATMSEAVQQGSSFVATLNTGEKVTLTAAAAGTTLSGTYTVVAGNNSADLTVASFATGTVKDAVGNAMTSTTVPAGTSNIAGSKDIVVDALPPTVTSFSSTTANGSYKAGDAINITATMSEAVQQGSSFDVTLDAGEKVTLTAAAAGTTLSGTYTVVAGNNSADLTVASFATGTVKDAVGNAMTSTTVPAGTSNIAGSKDIVVDAFAQAPTLTLAADTTEGSGTSSDNRTTNNTVNVGGLESGATWVYQVDGGAFTPGTGTTFTLSAGSHSYGVRQTDALGNQSEVATTTFALLSPGTLTGAISYSTQSNSVNIMVTGTTQGWAEGNYFYNTHTGIVTSIVGGSGADSINAKNYVSGATGLTFIGGPGNDTIIGTNALDTFNELGNNGAGADYISMGLGNDRLNVGDESIPSNDTYDGEGDYDYAQYSNTSNPYTTASITFTAVASDNNSTDFNTKVTAVGSTIGTDTLLNFESFNGSSADDSFDFSKATSARALNGFVGNDTIIGGAGNDTITGDTGNDIITGNGGNDTMVGGAGSDRFIYKLLTAANANGGNGTDTISDFVTNKDATLNVDEDIIDLRELFAGQTITASNLTSYLQMNGTALQVDRDGTNSNYSMTSLVTLTGSTLTTADLVNLFNAGQIIVA